MAREGQHSGISDDTRARARRFVEDAGLPKPAVTANPRPSKQRVVSKKELEESGLSLRDFLNRERGLTRREDKPMSKADAAKQLKLGEKPSKEDVASAKERLGIEDTSSPRLNSEDNKEATSETFKKGGKVKGWGMARGARKAKIR